MKSINLWALSIGGDIHIGDPAIDLAIAHSFLPVRAHTLFIKTYGDISANTWALAKLRAFDSSTLLVLLGIILAIRLSSAKACVLLRRCRAINFERSLFI